MSTSAYEIVRYRPELAEAVAELHAGHSQNAKASAVHLEWKYDQNPYIRDRLIYLALHQGRPVAMRGFYGSCWEAGDSRTIVPCASDLFVAPEHRNKGVVAPIMQQALAELKDMGFSHVFSLSAGDVAAMSARALGFKAIARAEPYVRMRRFTLTRLIFGPQPQLKRFDEVAARGRLGAGLEATEQPRVEAMAELVRRLGSSDRLRHVRDEAYLRWRYASPLRQFRFLYSGDRTLDGYMVLSVLRNDAVPAIRIVDWEGTDAAKRALLSAAIKAGNFRQVMTWKFGLAPSELDILKAYGLVPEPVSGGVKGIGISVFAKALRPEDAGARLLNGRPLFEPQSWHYRMVYSDFA